MARKGQGYNLHPPRIVPPLEIVPTGETIIIDGKVARIMKIQRAKTSDVTYTIKKKRSK